MARGRKYIRDSKRREVTGLSYHKGSGQYYSLVGNKRRYWGADKSKAIRAFQTEGEQTEDPLYDAMLSQWPVMEFKDRATGEEWEPSPHRLKDCLKVWLEWNGELSTAQETERKYNLFCSTVGNRPINALTFDHIKKWQRWVKKTATQRKWSVKTARDHHAEVSKILVFSKRKMKEWKFPDGLLEWVSDYKIDSKTPYKPKKSNRKPMPPEEFKKLIKECKKLQQRDPEKYSSTTQKGRANRKTAIDQKRLGVQLEALLKLCINCGLTTIDLCRIEWSNLNFSAKIMDFPRIKAEHKTGEAVERCTPLLPSTVKALKKWHQFEEERLGRKPTGVVFRSSSKRYWTTKTLSKAVGRLTTKEKTEQKWSLKHLRNVGSTLGYRSGLSPYLIKRFLGQVLSSSPDADYIDETLDPQLLVPLIKTINSEYDIP